MCSDMKYPNRLPNAVVPSPMQVGFYEFVVNPAYEHLAAAFPGTAPMRQHVLDNYAYWKGEASLSSRQDATEAKPSPRGGVDRGSGPLPMVREGSNQHVSVSIMPRASPAGAATPAKQAPQAGFFSGA